MKNSFIPLEISKILQDDKKTVIENNTHQKIFSMKYSSFYCKEIVRLLKKSQRLPTATSARNLQILN
jgi:hypothetical protein